jgi:hypothetical protein
MKVRKTAALAGALVGDTGALAGKITGGNGACRGDTGTIKGQGTKNGANVTVTYRHH